MSEQNPPYKWEHKLDIPSDSIDIHNKLCHALLHVKHGNLMTLDIPQRALEIIEEIQAPLRADIEYLEERLKEHEY